MALFNVKEIVDVQEVEKNQPHALRVKGKNKFALGGGKSKLAELVGPICKNESVHIASIGGWSLIDVIAYVIAQIGPSTVQLTSWAINEAAVVMLLKLREEGQIRSLHCLFASRTPSTCPEAWQLSEANIESLKLTQIHAKVVTLHSDSHSVVIVSSANLTNNPRIERYVITESEDLYAYDFGWINESIENGNPFQYDAK